MTNVSPPWTPNTDEPVEAPGRHLDWSHLRHRNLRFYLLAGLVLGLIGLGFWLLTVTWHG